MTYKASQIEVGPIECVLAIDNTAINTYVGGYIRSRSDNLSIHLLCLLHMRGQACP